MRRLTLAGAIFALLYAVALAPAYVEVPYSLGQVIKESSHIMLVEISKVDKTKNLIIFKKLTDLKGKHPHEVVKHNIGKGGFHPREWQNIMAWAEEGKKAVFFHNGGASETCIGTYWYQAYPQGEWWGMSHAEPFLLRTYCGDAEKLAAAVTAILKGEEVVVPCMVDGNKDLLHQRKAKLQMVKASLKRGNYDPKRDFVAFGGDGSFDIPEFKTTVLLAESADGWRFVPAKDMANAGNKWQQAEFDDTNWRTGKAPIGYGEPELQNRKGTVITEVGQPFLFRRSVDIPKEILDQKGVQIRLAVASDNSADVWINGQMVSQEGEVDHEFSYWSTEVELKAGQVKAGKNVIAVLVRNGQGSSDLFFDLELAAQVPLPRKVNPAAVAQKVNLEQVGKLLAKETAPAAGLTIDKAQKTVAIDCLIAPRKLPHLDKTYPIEVIACLPHPKGQKAHETIVVFDKVKPIQVHKALADLGLKSGNPARGEGAQAEGPEVKIFLEFTAANGQKQMLPIEQLLVDTKNGNKPIPAVKWHFTGSTLKQPNPEKDEQFYAADLSGTLISVFPVTDETVFQSQLTMKDEANIKLEIAPNLLPKEGSTARLIVQVP